MLKKDNVNVRRKKSVSNNVELAVVICHVKLVQTHFI